MTGAKRVIEFVMGGLVLAALLSAIATADFIPDETSRNLTALFWLLGFLGLIAMIGAMKYWSTVYIIGFVLGAAFLIYVGLMGWEIVLLVIVAILVLLERWNVIG